MRVDLFDFDLPEDRIALRPEKERSQARLLVVRPGGQAGLEDRRIGDLPGLLKAGDVLVVNDTKVISARLNGVRTRAGGESARIEVTLLERTGPAAWRTFAKPGKRLRVGDVIVFDALNGQASSLQPHPEEPRSGVSKDGPDVSGDRWRILRDAVPDGTAPQDEVRDRSRGPLTATVLGKNEAAVDLSFSQSGEDLDRAIEAAGDMPLPPYIAARRAPDAADRADYQTMFAAESGAVAAPTAGLHFTAGLLAQMQAAGIGLERVTLHVGAGTFLPVKAEDTSGHVMHSEWARLDAATADRLNAARASGGRVVAVGTTALRVLESAAASGRLAAFEGNTDIFITPGYRFRTTDALITNFHLPRSTLVMLVAAFVGHDAQQRAYAHAIATGYRFYSYGDASLLFGQHT